MISNTYNSTWIKEMNALLSSDETPHDVASAEALLNKHGEHNLEISLRTNDIVQFVQAGKKLIEEDHFLASEVSTTFVKTVYIIIIIS